MNQNNPLDYLLSFALSFAAGMLLLKYLERQSTRHFPVREVVPPSEQSKGDRDD